jgi:site-specific recombinase XerD
MKVQEQIDLELLQRKLTVLPDYIVGYIQYKLNILSPSSLLEYTRDFECFFNWLLIQLAIPNGLIKDIRMSTLNQLKVQHINNYIKYLINYRKLSPASISRKINSVRSMFNYYSDLAEDESIMPMISNNVMKEIVVKRPQNSVEAAQKIEQKILQPSEVTEFVEYLRVQYCKDICYNPQALYSYEINKSRDISIINLILNSGVRVSDIVNLNLSDLVLTKNLLFVHRLSSARLPISFNEKVKTDLETYFALRIERYCPSDYEQAVFLTIPNGKKQGKRMTKRAIQEMVIKYTSKYGKENLTVSNLRDSFGVKHLVENNIVHTKHQLLLNSIESVEKYLYLSQDLY